MKGQGADATCVASAPCDGTGPLEPREKFPCLSGNPVRAVLRTIGCMPSLEGAEFHGISFRAPRELGGDMFTAGGRGYGRWYGTPVVLNMLK